MNCPHAGVCLICEAESRVSGPRPVPGKPGWVEGSVEELLGLWPQDPREAAEKWRRNFLHSQPIGDAAMDALVGLIEELRGCPACGAHGYCEACEE
jgi:hypothetical protein